MIPRTSENTLTTESVTIDINVFTFTVCPSFWHLNVFTIRAYRPTDPKHTTWHKP